MKNSYRELFHQVESLSSEEQLALLVTIGINLVAREGKAYLGDAFVYLLQTSEGKPDFWARSFTDAIKSAAERLHRLHLINIYADNIEMTLKNPFLKTNKPLGEA